MKYVALLLLLLCPVAWATVGATPYTVTYTCTGGTGPFTFTFPISDPTALTVTVNSATITNYTVVAVNNNYANGGNVTLASACTSGQSLTLARTTPITQSIHYYDNMPIPMGTFERGLDKLTEIAQELNGVTASAPVVTTPGGALGDLQMKGTSTFAPAHANDNGVNIVFSESISVPGISGTSAVFSGLVSGGNATFLGLTLTSLNSSTLQCIHALGGVLSLSGADCGTSGGGGGNVTGSGLTNNAAVFGSAGTAITVDNAITTNGAGALTAAALYAPALILDSGYYLNLIAGDPYINFTSTDAFVYDRPTQNLTLYENSTPQFTVTPSYASFAQSVTASRYFIDPNFNLTLASGNPTMYLNSSDNSFISYDRALRNMTFFENGSQIMALKPTGATVSNLTVTGTCIGCGTVNLSSPAPIGNTTPNTGAFTGFTTTGNSIANGTFGVHSISGFPSGTAGYSQVAFGNLMGSYSFFPYSWWATQRAPIKWVWESATPGTGPGTGNDVGMVGLFFVNPTTGSTTTYGKSAIDFRTFVTDSSPFNVGSGTGSFWTTVYVSNTGLNGGTDTVVQLGDAGHTGISAAGQAAEFDVLNYGIDQSNPTGVSSTRGESIVCGNNQASQTNCTVGLYVYGDGTQRFHRGLEIDNAIDWSIVVPNNVPIGAFGSSGSAIYNILQFGNSNNLVVGGDPGVTSIEYGPSGSNFLSQAGHAVCVKADGKSFGYCSTAVNSSGVCTCN